VGGSVLAGETSPDAAIREVKEEVGIELCPADGRLVFSKAREYVLGEPWRDILDVWLFRYNGQVSLADATTDEVCQVRWMTVPEIQARFDSGKFVDTLAYFFNEVDTQ
jgi:8-oxo-dGTP pyrophosphatase MutT (NUDIX family)